MAGSDFRFFLQKYTQKSEGHRDSSPHTTANKALAAKEPLHNPSTIPYNPSTILHNPSTIPYNPSTISPNSPKTPPQPWRPRSQRWVRRLRPGFRGNKLTDVAAQRELIFPILDQPLGCDDGVTSILPHRGLPAIVQQGVGGIAG